MVETSIPTPYCKAPKRSKRSRRHGLSVPPMPPFRAGKPARPPQRHIGADIWPALTFAAFSILLVSAVYTLQQEARKESAGIVRQLKECDLECQWVRKKIREEQKIKYGSHE